MVPKLPIGDLVNISEVEHECRLMRLGWQIDAGEKERNKRKQEAEMAAQQQRERERRMNGTNYRPWFGEQQGPVFREAFADDPRPLGPSRWR